jgi:hypothetical protein
MSWWSRAVASIPEGVYIYILRPFGEPYSTISE